MKNALLTAGLLLIGAVSLAQTGNISGRLTDATTRQPLPFANVYVNNTTLGTVTNSTGDFTISTLPTGSTEVIFSYIGYTTQEMTVVVKATGNTPLDIRLRPDAKQMVEVAVKAGRDKEWEKQLKRFEKVFFGNTARCKLLNPWVIDFVAVDGLLTANALVPLEIENRALGYKLFFQLKKAGFSATNYSIVGTSRFVELPAITKSEALDWTKNRERAYRGSVKHLMKSILDKQLSRQGFSLYRDKEKNKPRGDNFSVELDRNLVPYDTAAIVFPLAGTDAYRIMAGEKLEVHYTGGFVSPGFYRDISHPVSWLDVKGGVMLVNKDGTLLNATDVAISGNMADARVAGMLPLDYRPGSLVLPLSPAGLLAKRLRESVYLHTDKPYYYAGDDLWFSAFMQYPVPGLMDSLSRVLYVDLIGPDQRIVQDKILQLMTGRAANRFQLPATLLPGQYVLRAYTQWMRNYGADPFFYQPLVVLPPDKRADEPAVAPTSDAALAISFDQTTYKKRSPVRMALTLDTLGREPLNGRFSVTVFDETQTVAVARPASVKSPADMADPAENGPAGVVYPVEKGITLAGVYKDRKGKSKKTSLTLLPATFGGIYQTTTASDGTFRLANMLLYDTTQCVVQPDGGQVTLLTRERPALPENMPAMTVRQVAGNAMHRLPATAAPVATLAEVTVRGRKTERAENGYAHPDMVLKGESLAGYATIAEAIAAKLPSFKLIYDQTNWFLIWARSSVPTSSDLAGKPALASHEPTLYINNVLVVGEFTGDRLMQLSPALIDHLEVNGMITANQGANGSGGLINVYTRRAEATPSPALSILNVRGFDREVLFQSPDYRQTSSAAALDDYRSTLYWNPCVTLTSSRPVVSLSFFTSDQTGAYRVIVEGVTSQGHAVHGEAIITVTN